MKRPNFITIFDSENDYCEKSSDLSVDSFVPNQAIELAELISRFERGQRLNVHQNFSVGANFTNDKIVEETFEEAPPDDVHDIVDVHNYYQEHLNHKADYAEKSKKKKSEESPTSPKEKGEDESDA